jgi:uncharacterized protein (TIGR00369 family)
VKDIHFPFLDHLGATIKSASEGKAQIELTIKPFHLQHLGFVHGGVISTLMDNVGGCAAGSSIKEGQTVVTMEIKINYLKPAKGEYLLANAEVKRQGRTTSFVTIELMCNDQLVAYATATYSIL